MKLAHSFFGIAPEPPGGVVENTAPANFFPLINLQMFVPGKHKSIIDSKFIGINDRVSSVGLDCQAENSFSLRFFESLYFHMSFSLENAKNEDLVPSPSLLQTMGPYLKIGLIHLDFTFEEIIAISGMGNNCLSDEVKCF